MVQAVDARFVSNEQKEIIIFQLSLNFKANLTLTLDWSRNNCNLCKNGGCKFMLD